MRNRYALTALLLFFVGLAAGIVTAGFLLYQNQRDICRTEAVDRLAAVADLKTSDLSRWRKERLGDARLFHKNLLFSKIVRELIERPQDATLREELDDLLNRVRDSYGYSRIALLDADGNECISVPDPKEPFSSASVEMARDVVRSGQVVFEDFRRNEHTNKVYLRLFVPIVDETADGRSIGVLMLRIDPNAYLYPMIQRWPTPTETAETLLLRREGDEAVFLNELKFKKDTALALRISLDHTTVPGVKAALGREGVVEGMDYRGVPVLAALRAVPDSPWFLVARMDAAEVYSPMNRWFRLTVLFVGALLFGAAAILGSVWRQRHAALCRAKHQVEQRYRTLFENSREALLTLEPPSWEFTTPNTAALRMFGASEASELTAVAPCQLSPERQPGGRKSSEKSGEMIEKALLDGSCFFEWTHKRLDGEEFPASVLLSKMETDGKVFLLATMRDITERRRAEKEIQASEHKIRSVIQGSPIPTFVIGPDHRILHWNRALEELSGIRSRDVIGTTDQWRAFYPKGPEPCLADLILNEDVEAIEVRYADKYRKSSLIEDTYEAVDFFSVLGDGGCWLKFTATLIRGTDGEVIGAMEVLENVTYARRAEEALRESERRFLDVLYASEDAILLIGDNAFIDCNEATVQMLGYATREELLQKHPSLLSPPVQPDGRSSRDKADEMIWLAHERGFHRFEWVHRRANGEDFPVEVSLTPIVHQGKSLLYCVWRDVTERKHAEERLREFKTAVEQSADGIALADLNGCLHFVNHAWAKMHGQPAEELVGKHLGVCHTKEQNETEVNAFNKRLLETGSVEDELGHVRRDGTAFQTWMSATLLKDSDGKPCGLIGVARDITEQKRADERLRENEARLRAITDSAQDAIIMMDHQGMISFWNPAAEKILGYREEDVIGRNLHELLAPQRYHAAQHAAFPRFQRTGQGDAVGKTHELEARRKDGREIPVALSLSRVRVGENWHAVGIIRDETERKTTENELIRAKLAAEAANRAKSEFLANMSHEIRTPLNGLLGMLHLIKASGVSGEVECYTEMATRAGKRLTGLLGDILDLSRIEAGRMPLAKAPFLLREIQDSLAETFSPVNFSKRVSFQAVTWPGLPERVVGDEVRVRQILFNLIGNALKFTDSGAVRLDISPLAPTPAQRVRLLFIVSDTGIGIPDAQLGTVCAPFIQVSMDIARSHQGAGLGLSIAHNLVDAMGGTLTIESVEGQGTTVYLMLPFDLPLAEAGETPPQGGQAEPPQPMRLLLVEDDDISRLSAELGLRKLGHHVRTACNGQEALEALRAERFDCVLMDIQMGGMDGLTATRNIRSGESGVLDPGIPIVALTAYAGTEDRDRFLASGMDDYVAKPVQPLELRTVLARIRARLGASLQQ